MAQCAPSHRGPAGLDPYEFHAFHHALKQVRVNRYCKKFQEPSNLKELCIDVFVEGTTCNRPQGIDPWSLPNSIHHPVRTVPVGEMRQRNGAGGKALHLRFPAFFSTKIYQYCKSTIIHSSILKVLGFNVPLSGAKSPCCPNAKKPMAGSYTYKSIYT